jgi:3-phosphoshikimate 1-carboxyvinyltransferase
MGECYIGLHGVSFGMPGALETVCVARSTTTGGRVRVPGSKSMTNRALVAAALASGTSRITGGLVGDDADSMVAGLRQLGAGIREIAAAGASPVWEVSGTGGIITGGPLVIDAAMAGTTLRFLAAVAALSRGSNGDADIVITGRPGLLGRPVGPLLDALRACGAAVTGSGPSGEHAPIHVRPRRGPLGGRVAVDATKSSQFATAVLLVAPCFDASLELEASGLGAAGFVELTVELMAHFGVPVSQQGSVYGVPTGGYEAADYAVPPDASAASHLLTLAVATRGSVTVEGLLDACSQPDFAVLDTLRAFGADVHHDDTDRSVTVSGPDQLRAVDVDLRAMPDQLPNVAVLAALAPGASRISGVGITRFHESDRMAAVAFELAKVGVRVDLEDDALVVHGGTARTGSAGSTGAVTVSSHDDHRLAMALAALGAALGNLAIGGADAVSKTYRDFWRDARAIGLRTERIEEGAEPA